MNEMIKKVVCDKGGKMKMGAVCMRLIFKLFSGVLIGQESLRHPQSQGLQPYEQGGVREVKTTEICLLEILKKIVGSYEQIGGHDISRKPLPM